MANLKDLASEVARFLGGGALQGAQKIQQAKPQVTDFIQKYPTPMSYMNAQIPGGVQGGAQRVQQSFQNPQQYNFYQQAAQGNLPVPQPFKGAGQFIGNYVQNRYVNPIVNLPKNFQEATRTDKPLLTGQRGQAALGALGGVATLFPDPIQDAALPIYDYFKGMKANSLRGGSPLENVSAGLKSLSMEKPVGLGDALSTDPTTQLVGNIAELPLSIAMTAKLGKGQTLGFSKDVVKKARQSFSPEVRSAIGEFAQIVETNPGANKANLGQLGDYVQSVAEGLFGEKAANLTNKQLKNLFDVLVYQVDEGMPRSHFPIGLNASSIRQGMEESYSPAQKNLKSLMNYSDDLLDRGYTRGEVDNISYTKYKEIVKNNLDPTEFRLLKQQLAGLIPPDAPKNVLEQIRYNWNQTFGPVKNLPETFQKDYSQWIGKHSAARTTGTMTAEQFRSIPEKIGMQVIDNIERPNAKAPQDVKVWSEALNRKFNELYSYAQQSGVDIGFLKNYITHIWQEDAQTVEKVLSASKTFKFAKDRKIPTYAEGIAAGLTPKYTNPSQIIGEYVTRLEKTKANIEFINILKQQDLISTKAKVGQIALHGIGMDGKYASPQVARLINRMFEPQGEGGLLNMVGKASSKLQDITLSGGIPGTPVNAFTLGQMIKEATAFRVFSPMKSLFRSLSDDASQSYFKNNADLIKEMQLFNIPVRTAYDFDNFYSNPAIKKTFKEALGDKWTQIFNAPTFERFMPMLNIEFYKNAKQKLGNAEQAANATRKFYGIVSEDVIGRPQGTADFLKTFFFAPRFREGMLNFWGNVLNPKELIKTENFALRRFWMGLGLSLAAYDAVNYHGTGKHLWENPEGKELTAMIPMGETTIGIPFLPSVATLPRMFVSMANFIAHGDVAKAGLEARKSSSTLVKPFMDVMANENYFGQEIYSEDDTTAGKWKNILEYVGGQWNHPFIREAYAAITGKKPIEQAIINATEAPIRFYKTDNLITGEFWDEFYKLKEEMDGYKKLSEDEQIAYEAKNQDKIIEFMSMNALVTAYSDIKKNEGTDKAKEYLIENMNDRETVEAPQLTEEQVRKKRVEDNINNLVNYQKRQENREAEARLSQTKHVVENTGVSSWSDKTYVYLDKDGKLKTLDTSFEPVAPKLTGNELLDKELTSKYRTELSQKRNILTDLYEQNQLPKESVERQLQQLAILYGETNTTGAAELEEEIKSREKSALEAQQTQLLKDYTEGKVSSEQAMKQMADLETERQTYLKGRGRTLKVSFKMPKAPKTSNIKIRAPKIPKLAKAKKTKAIKVTKLKVRKTAALPKKLKTAKLKGLGSTNGLFATRPDSFLS